MSNEGGLPEDATVVDAESDSIEDIVAALRDALGMDEDETLHIKTPQFDREDGVEPADPPLTFGAMNRLRTATKDELEQLGLRKWSDETGLWLLPHEWHPHIPPEYPLLDILDATTTRAAMPADPDKRFGVLSAGIVPDFERTDGERACVPVRGDSE